MAKQSFDCPGCGTRCSASPQRNGSAKLKHPKPVCEAYSAKLLMQAYVIACRPEPKFPPWDEIAREIYRKGIE
jgi:hypothetical protein